MSQGVPVSSFARRWRLWARGCGACIPVSNCANRRRCRAKRNTRFEKYEIRVRDFTAPGNIIAEIAQLNRIRRQNPALHTHLGLKIYNARNDNILYFGKRSADGSNFVLVAVSLDPHNVQEANFELPLWEMGLPDDATTHGEDLMNGHRWDWHGKYQFMRIDPAYQPFGIWRISAT